MEILRTSRQWLDWFHQQKGRYPKVLHIGNIANNAYQNAKILNEAGLHNDVISYDYYHIMGCPEWDDAEITGSLTSHFQPDWSKVELGGFQRPEWFANGQIQTCLEYLILKNLSNNNLSIIIDLLNKQNGFSDKKTNRHELLMQLSGIIRKKLSILPKPIKRIARIFYNESKKIISPELRKIETKKRELYNQLALKWKTAFPERSDNLDYLDVAPYLQYIDKWDVLLSQYDYIIAYSTDPIIPLLCNKPYLAFEHGTIREIPYQQNSQGRCTALSYRYAQHVFVTNFDCIPSAEILAPKRYSPINHPWDENHGNNITGDKTLRQKTLKELDSDFLCFFPTRHDWSENLNDSEKGNDIFLRAIGQLRRMGFRIGVVCIDWGKNIQESKKLIKEEGFEANTLWSSPLEVIKFERMCKASDVVIDQFILGAFGGVLIKSMCMGSPVLTYINEMLVLKQYPESPPVINCRVQKEIEAQLEFYYTHRNKLSKLGCRGREWIEKYHTKEITLNKLLHQLSRVDLNLKTNNKKTTRGGKKVETC